MGSNKSLLLLALFVALVLVAAASRDLAETSAEKENRVTTESSNIGGVDDAKQYAYGTGGSGGYGGRYQGGNGGYGDNGGYGYGYGYGGNGGRQGGYGGSGGRCSYGCCSRNDYGRECRRCCSYAGQTVDRTEP